MFLAKYHHDHFHMDYFIIYVPYFELAWNVSSIAEFNDWISCVYIIQTLLFLAHTHCIIYGSLFRQLQVFVKAHRTEFNLAKGLVEGNNICYGPTCSLT